MLNLSVGEPDFDTPDNIKEYIEAIKNGFTKLQVGNFGVRERNEKLEGERFILLLFTDSCFKRAKHSLYNIFYQFLSEYEV